MIATTANIDPIDSDPVSPINISAGQVLNQRKPKPEPINAAQTTKSSPVPGIKGMLRQLEKLQLPPIQAKIAKAPLIKITGIIAKPSSPSVRLTALELPTITRQEIMNNPITPISNAASLKNGIRSCVSIEEEAIDTSHPPITIAPNDWAKKIYTYF